MGEPHRILSAPTEKGIHLLQKTAKNSGYLYLFPYKVACKKKNPYRES